jgi:nucleoside-diphosphate-sugar epimerase
MNILITGINGFVGKNLIPALSGHIIYGISSSPSRKEEGHIDYYSWDELIDLPSSVDVVIHLAGKAHDTKDKTEAQVYYDINTELTKKIFNWFLQSAAEKFIFFSSVKAAADTVDDILTEDAIPCPQGPYGESKKAAEEYVLANMPINKSAKYVYILRPCMIHGPGNKGNLNLLYNIVRKGIPWPLGAFANRRSFISLENLNFIISELLEQKIASGIYNIADDNTLSTNELICLMCEKMALKCRILNINKSIIKGVAMIGSVLHLPLNQERLKKLTENYIVSNAKIKNALGINRLPLSAIEGLIKTLDSFEIEDIQS